MRAAYVSSSAPGYQVAIRVTGTAAGHAINVTGTGEFEQAAHASRLTLDMNPPTLGSAKAQIDEVILGKDVYVKLPAPLAGKIPGGRPWLELNLSEVGERAGIPGLSSLTENPGENPARLLQFLRAISTGKRESLGRQTIDGVSTSVSRATIDLSKVVGTLPRSQRRSASLAIAWIEKLTGLRYLPIKAWVDSSDHFRRMVMSAAGHVEGQPFSESIRLDVIKYGSEPVPTAPSADEVTNVMSLLGTR